MDSVKATYGQVLVVDNGGFFPEQDTHQDVAWFLMDAMKVLDVDVIGLGDRDLRFGLAFLRAQIKRTRVPMISANLLESGTKKPALTPHLIKKVGTVKVGLFSLIGESAHLGPAADSLAVSEPQAVARQTVEELRKKGAEVVVLLSQLGKVESEDLASAVDGIDAVIVGRNSPVLQRGRMVKNTVVCYGGEQGQYLCRTELSLDASRRVTTGEAAAIMLGPEVPDKPEVAKLVKSFEDGFNEKMRKLERERAAGRAQLETSAEAGPDHFLGADICMRCHVEEGRQWKTTSHSVAWQTLVEVKKDATPDCIPCHVVGFRQSGGFVDPVSTPHLGNVQCENCHGMGTLHDAFATTPRMVTEETCVTCHQGENDPEFSWEKKLPMIAHSNDSGETIQHKKIDVGKKSSMMNGHDSH